MSEGDHVHGIVSERDLAISAGNDLDSTTAGDLDSRRLAAVQRNWFDSGCVLANKSGFANRDGPLREFG